MIKSEMELITPEKAIEYLKANTDNYRKISRNKVGLYASEMKAGRWQANGEGIMFDETGMLKNGQHRLAAIVAAKVPVQMLVVRGVNKDVNIYDSGMTRSLAQMASTGGSLNMTKTECAAGTAIAGAFTDIPKGEALEYIKAHADELKRAFRVCGANINKGVTCRASCVIAAVLMLYEGIPAYELEVFFNIMRSGNIVGADGYEASSALVARRMFEERYKGNIGGRRVIKEQVEIVVLAITDFHKGKSRQLNYQVKEPMLCLEKLEVMRKAHGLVG